MSLPSLSFSDNNHWRFGWGDGLYNFQNQYRPLWVTFGPCRYFPQTFDVEIAVAARKIAEAATKPIYVAMSGGIDSELVARTMLQERIPFTPLIAQFENDYNKDDIAYALDFCRRHNLTPEIVKLDIIAFFKDSIHTPYILANCAHLMQMHLMRHAARLGGMAVIAVGEQRYAIEDGKVFVPVPIERIAVTHFMQAEGVEGVSAFYCYTPEMMLSLLREAKAHGFGEVSEFAHNIKEDIYRKFWPDLSPRPKYSGFENVLEHRRAAQKKLHKKYGPMLIKFMIPLDELELQLSKGL
ncbi:MAG: hypothetical protein HY053_03140 [Proteobacteria bacterium]|nr:hypothetical protein [Pseudomonadota bacterium]